MWGTINISKDTCNLNSILWSQRYISIIKFWSMKSDMRKNSGSEGQKQYIEEEKLLVQFPLIL